MSEVTELRKLNEKDARALGNVDSIIQNVSEIKTLIQHISNINNLERNVRPNRVNEAIQEHVRDQNLTQNNAQQDDNRILQQNVELQQKMISFINNFVWRNFKVFSTLH